MSSRLNKIVLNHVYGTDLRPSLSLLNLRARMATQLNSVDGVVLHDGR